jgi:hypothetical protein
VRMDFRRQFGSRSCAPCDGHPTAPCPRTVNPSLTPRAHLG